MATTRPDPYTVLGLTPDATDTDIAHAYRGLMRQHHPDTRARPQVAGAVRLETGAADADELSKDTLSRIMDAYLVLGDRARRAAYDHGQIAAAGSGSPSSSPSSGPAVPVVAHYRSPHRHSSPPIQATPVRWLSLDGARR